MVLRGNLQYIQRDIGYIEKMVAHGVSLSLLGNDLYRKLLVIQELCRQQWDMYVRKSHQIEDRMTAFPNVIMFCRIAVRPSKILSCGA